MAAVKLEDFIEANMRQSSRYVPARVQAAMALLERLRDKPALQLDAHKKPNSAGLISHETYGSRVHKRLDLGVINKTHGRRSSDIPGWGQQLLDRVAEAGFESAPAEERSKMLDDAQSYLGGILRGVLDQEPLEARVKGRTAEAVIRDVLRQAEGKGKSGEVAQYLVAAKLQLRLGREIEVVGYNRGDRRSRFDAEARTGDFEFDGTTIEVAVGLPDEKHLAQVADALEDTDFEIWLLTRHDRVPTWSSELEKAEGVDMKRVVVTSVEGFVGQNISELAEFSPKRKATQLAALVSLYNDRWVARSRHAWNSGRP